METRGIKILEQERNNLSVLFDITVCKSFLNLFTLAHSDYLMELKPLKFLIFNPILDAINIISSLGKKKLIISLALVGVNGNAGCVLFFNIFFSSNKRRGCGMIYFL